MSDLESRYLTVPQVAAELQMDASAVYKMCKSQQLPSVRFGKSVRIPRLAYERYLQRLESGHPKPLEHDLLASENQLIWRMVCQGGA